MNNKVILEVKDLKKSYHEGKITTEVLKGINLQIFEGEMVAIVGSSGSGKSTLLHMLGISAITVSALSTSFIICLMSLPLLKMLLCRC